MRVMYTFQHCESDKYKVELSQETFLKLDYQEDMLEMRIPSYVYTFPYKSQRRAQKDRTETYNLPIV